MLSLVADIVVKVEKQKQRFDKAEKIKAGLEERNQMQVHSLHSSKIRSISGDSIEDRINNFASNIASHIESDAKIKIINKFNKKYVVVAFKSVDAYHNYYLEYHNSSIDSLKTLPMKRKVLQHKSLKKYQYIVLAKQEGLKILGAHEKEIGYKEVRKYLSDLKSKTFSQKYEDSDVEDF